MTRVYDRQKAVAFEERVYGGAVIDWAYNSGLGRQIVLSPTFQRALSRVVGRYQEHPVSKRAIEGFVQSYGIDMSEFESPTQGFQSFNDFFIRKLRPNARPFPEESTSLGAPAEGRLSVFHIDSPATVLTIKGKALSIERLLSSHRLAHDVMGGYAFVFRLCPVDYHRFHFPDAGIAGESKLIRGKLHSVNPASLNAVPEVFLENERRLCEFKSENFGRLLLLEVGAMCVGKIHQTYVPGKRVERGSEKGFFAFGGSTTIMVSHPGKVQPHADLLEKTAQGLECLVRLGEAIAHTKS
jgi:phosphatidylserine decarboxylase